jgi:hypothetical protein
MRVLDEKGVPVHEVKMRVLDEKGVPVAGAMMKIIFIDPNSERVTVGVSGPDGRFSSRGRGTNSVMLKVTKDGHYPVRVEGLSKDQDHDVEVVLPRVINSIPLFASYIDSAGRIPGDEMVFPVHNQWIGFDLEMADWVTPHGKGKTADFLLRFRNEFKGLEDSSRTMEERIASHKRLLGYSKEEWTMDKFKIHAGKWDGLVEMSFPGEGEGILEAERFVAYSPLKLPHRAPVDGYSSSWKRAVNNYIHYGTPNPFDRAGFFLRTRVKKDQQGRIISANYAKFIGRMNARASTGQIEFLYYFNPTPNDRNLEFDPKGNLFPKDKPGSNVYDP